jgi:methionine synthase / methylenetetrahydrofolate reductase(NADPH)
MANSLSFLERLQQPGPLLADGAMGTMLNQLGVKPGVCYDAINLSDPRLVSSVHERYLSAGAEIIETNTFGSNAIKLSEYNLQDQVVAINEAAVEIAQNAVRASYRDNVYIAGALGPLGVHIAPLGRISSEEATRLFRQQLATLIHAGVDLVLLETFTDLKQLKIAIETAKSIKPGIPVVASMTFTRDNRTMLGDTPATVGRQLVETEADVIGVNCSGGPTQLRNILRQIREAVPDAHLLVMPNAGWPEMHNGRLSYPAAPDYFADFALSFEALGAKIIGGCCGTTPDHIKAMRQALDDDTQPHAVIDITAPATVGDPDVEAEPPSALATRLANGEFVVTVEMAPPRGSAPEKVIAAAEMLKRAGATNINVSDSPMARMRMSPWAVAYLIQQQVGLEAVLHFPTRGRNLLRVQGDLLAAHAMGIRNIFVVMGDPTHIGDYPDASNTHDIVPSGLVRLIKQQLNTGIDGAGNTINKPTNFLVGSALNLNRPELDKEVDLLKKKIDAGADFALTQPIYSPHLAERFITRYEELYGPLNLPIIVGLLPIYNAKHGNFLHNEVPGINIPDVILDRVASADEDEQSDIGVKVAQELLLDLKDIVQGVYLMPPFARYNMAADVMDVLAVPVS